MSSKRLSKKKKKLSHHNGIYDEEFVVEAIRDKTVVAGKALYLVKWVGFPESQCTWEPIDHLDKVLDMVESFNKDYVPGKKERRIHK